MSVTIINPPDDGDPFGNPNWTATATFELIDTVDGILWDLDTNEIYPSNNPSVSPSGGVYTWTVPFQHDTDIQAGDTLLIFCYDSETGGDGGTRIAVANGVGRPPYHIAHTGGPSIAITSATPSGSMVRVKAELTAKTRGTLFLMLVNHTKGDDIHNLACHIQAHHLPPSANSTRYHTFGGIDPDKWTHIAVIAVMYKQGGSCPKKATTVKWPTAKEKDARDKKHDKD